MKELDFQWKCKGHTAGIPAWRASSEAARAVNGVNSEGLTTTVQPEANAGPTW